MSKIAEQYDDDEENDGIDHNEIEREYEEYRTHEEYLRLKEAHAEFLAKKEKDELLQRKKLVYKKFIIFYGALTIGGMLITSAYSKVLFTTILMENWQVAMGVSVIAMAFLYIILPGVLSKDSFRDVDLRQREIKENSPISAWPFPTSVRPGDDDVDVNERISLKEKDQFIHYFEEMSLLLQEKASIAEEKASLLLDKGSKYTLAGIFFFIFSIVAWQILSWIHGFKVEFIYGIASCSGLFVFIEVLSGWYLKQYRHYVDTSTYLLKIKAMFDKFMLAYLSQSSLVGTDIAGKREINKVLLSMLEKDIRWPNAYMLKRADANFAIEAVETLSKLSKRLSRKDKKKVRKNSKELKGDEE